MTETTEKELFYQPSDEQTPKLPFDETHRGLQLLAQDIKNYYQRHKRDKPQGIIMRTLSVVQILILVGALVGFSYCIIWILTHLLPW